MALQQQLSHAGGGSEIAVDLENAAIARRMGVEQIGTGTVLNQ